MNFLQTLLEFLFRFWPFVIIEQWERGILYVLGHAAKWDLKPGLYVTWPVWFMRIEPVPVVPVPISSPLLNITLSDGKTLSYSVTAIIRVTNAWKAENTVQDYEESASELLSSKTSEKLALVPSTRLDAKSRKRLVADLLRWVNEELEEYGMEALSLRFTNFAIEQRAYRLLTDTALSPSQI